jgi:2-keto-4-pentenoate hydratase/2-oxohepta-3-ene-1,7-dioic acid hydratase in catechol pathway
VDRPRQAAPTARAKPGVHVTMPTAKLNLRNDVMTTQHWIRFTQAGKTGFGTLEGETVRVFDGDMFAAPTASGAVLALRDVTLRHPAQPGKVIAMVNNFRALLKAPSSTLDPGGVITKPACDSRIIFEGELAIVIGRSCKGVSEAHALDHVFGYTCVNDVTATDLLTRDPGFAQWARAKSFDTFCPFGPAIATGLDPEKLVVRTTLNGSLRQDFSVSDMLFSVPQLVSRLSFDMTLNPGDMICCGTSVGVGVMKPGSTVEVEIEGIGKLVNRFE